MTSHDFASLLTYGTSGSLCAEWPLGFDGCRKLLAQAAFEAHCKVRINLRALVAIAGQCHLDGLYTAVEVAAADV